MNYSEWEKAYSPIKNTLVKHAPYSECMFETYGKEVEFVSAQDVHNIWTIRDESGVSIITAGMGWVNRMGYLITETPWTDENEVVELTRQVQCACFKEQGYGPYTFPNGYVYWEDGDRNCEECEGDGKFEEWID